MPNGILMPNLLVLALAALIPLIIGFVWYNPKVFGTAWMGATGLTQDSMKGASMPLVLGLTYLFSFFIAFGLQFIVIHQFHLYSMLAHEPGIKDKGTDINNWYVTVLNTYGNRFRTFKHGAFHGTIAGIAIALPIVAVNSLFERRGFKYIAITAGYWIFCFMLMGAVICHFS